MPEPRNMSDSALQARAVEIARLAATGRCGETPQRGDTKSHQSDHAELDYRDHRGRSP